MKNKLTILFFLLISCLNTGFAQDFKEPSKGKAVVYFMRSSALGAAVNFKYFDGDKYIGKFNYGKYLRYECEPGQHILWAKAENRDFIEANLEAGKIYIINSEVKMGAMKARVKLNPSDFRDPKVMEKLKKIANKKPPYVIAKGKLEKKNQDYKEMIKKGLAKYEETKTSTPYIRMNPDMNYVK